MAEDPPIGFSDEEIGRQAQADAAGLALAVMAYARELELSPEDMWWSIGLKFAPGWEALQGAPVRAVARQYALNWIAFGAQLRAFSADDVEARIVTAGWPPAAGIDAFGLTLQDADAVWWAAAAIAEHLGLAYEWQRAGDEVIETLRRPGPEWAQPRYENGPHKDERSER